MPAPPIARVALAYAAGAALGTSGAPVWTAPLLAMLGLAAPIGASRVPARAVTLLIALAGALATRASVPSTECPAVVDGERVAVRGRFLATPRGGSAPFRPGAGCGALTVVTADTLVRPGVAVTVEGTGRLGRGRPWIRVGEGGVRPAVAGASGPEGAFWIAVRWRDRLVRRLDRLYGPRAPLVAALTLARREGMDPAVREAFARTVARAVGREARVFALPAPVVSAALALIGAAAGSLGRTTILNRDKARELLQPAWTGDPSPLTRDTGWQAGYDLASGARATAQWYRQHGWL